MHIHTSRQSRNRIAEAANADAALRARYSDAAGRVSAELVKLAPFITDDLALLVNAENHDFDALDAAGAAFSEDWETIVNVLSSASEMIAPRQRAAAIAAE